MANHKHTRRLLFICLLAVCLTAMLMPVAFSAGDSATFSLETDENNSKGIYVHLRGMDTDSVMYMYPSRDFGVATVRASIEGYVSALKFSGFEAVEQSKVDWWSPGSVFQDVPEIRPAATDFAFAEARAEHVLLLLSQGMPQADSFSATLQSADGARTVDVIQLAESFLIIYSPASSAPHGYYSVYADEAASVSASLSADTAPAGGGRELPAARAPAQTASAAEFYMVLEANDGKTYTFDQTMGLIHSISSGAKYIRTEFFESTDRFRFSHANTELRFPLVSAGTVLTSENLDQFPYGTYILKVYIEALGGWGFQTKVLQRNGVNDFDFRNQRDPAYKDHYFRLAIDSVENGVYTGTFEFWTENAGYSPNSLTSGKGSFRFTTK